MVLFYAQVGVLGFSIPTQENTQVGDDMSKNTRYANGNARRKLRARLKAEQRDCWICKAFGRPAHIDYDLPHLHPMSFVVDELIPVSKGGSPLDYYNVDAAHRSCNGWRSNKDVSEVMKLAREARGIRATLPQPFGDW